MKKILLTYTDSLESRYILFSDIKSVLGENNLYDIATTVTDENLKDLELIDEFNNVLTLNSKHLVNDFKVKLGLFNFHFQRMHILLHRQKLDSLIGNKLLTKILYILSKSNIINLGIEAFVKNIINTSSVKKNNLDGYDIILFSRPDSAFNYEIWNKYVTKKTKCYCFVRNIDYWELKGNITHNYDKYIDISGIRAEYSAKYIDESKLVRIKNKFELGEAVHSNIILFATSQEKFNYSNFSQYKYAEILYKLSKKYGYRLVIRKHHEDHTNYSLISPDVSIYSNNTKTYFNDDGTIYHLNTLQQIEEYYNMLSFAKFIFTITSTVVVDGLEMKKKCYFLDFGIRESDIYERKHLKYLIGCGVTKLNSIRDLMQVFINENT